MFSDYAYPPLCYFGFLRLERMHEKYDLRVNWCITKICPDLPPERSSVQRARPFGRTVARVVANLAVLGAQKGVRWGDFSRASCARRALLLAEATKELGATAFYPMHKRLFEIGLCEGRNLADEAVLRAEAASLGLDPQQPERA